jgi:excisionase family DNA binding protein
MTPPDTKNGAATPGAPGPDDEILSTRDVARLLVVSEATVKRWADDALLACYRTPGGHRKFLKRDVAVFMRERGFVPPASRLPEATPAEALRLARAGDLPALEQMASAALDAGLTLEGLCDTVLVPALAEIGDRWACAEATVVEEHVVSSAMIELLARLRIRAERTELHGGLAVIACATGERHDIAARMLSVVLRSRGWSTLDTGPDAPALDVVKLAVTHGARLVCVSASAIGAGREGAAEVLRVYLEHLPPAGIRIFAGGSAYEVGRPPEGVASARDMRSFARELDAILRAG